MTETIFVSAKIMGFVFIMCKIINGSAQDSDSADGINLWGGSLSIQIGNFTPSRKN